MLTQIKLHQIPHGAKVIHIEAFRTMPPDQIEQAAMERHPFTDALYCPNTASVYITEAHAADLLGLLS